MFGSRNLLDFFCMWFIVLKGVDQSIINGEERRKRSRSKTLGGKCNDGRDRCNETKTPEKNETIILRMSVAALTD